MNKRYIILFVVGLHFSMRAENLLGEGDRISGALMGATIGDAFGQVTASFSSFKAITAEYGKYGLSSLSQFKDEDWYTDSTDIKRIPYTRNTMISSLSCTLLAQMRKEQLSGDFYATRFAQSFHYFYGEEDVPWDVHFSQWYQANKINLKENELVPSTQYYYWMSQGGDSRVHYCYHNPADEGALSRAWPVALVYADNLKEARKYSDFVTMMTHTHPTARAATAAYVTGMITLLKGGSVTSAVDDMVKEAEKFDSIESQAKNNSIKISSDSEFKPLFVAQGRLLTSDLIRYAVWLAQEGKTPEEVFGVTSKKQESNRSFRGYLLGYQADEAVAAAVYLLLRHPDSFKKVIAEGSLACGNTPLITSLAGALSGAHLGIETIKNDGFVPVLESLENSEKLAQLPSLVTASRQVPITSFGSDIPDMITMDDAAVYYDLNRKDSNWRTFKRLFLAGGLALGAYLYMRS